MCQLLKPSMKTKKTRGLTGRSLLQQRQVLCGKIQGNWSSPRVSLRSTESRAHLTLTATHFSSLLLRLGLIFSTDFFKYFLRKRGYR